MQSQLHVLTIEITIGDHKEMIYPVVLKDDTYCVLIDAGYPNHLDQLEAAIRQVGMEPKDLTHLIITHHDHDHMGAAAEIKRKYPQVIVMASQAESPYISGEKKALRLEQAEVLQKTLPPEKQAFGQAFAAYLKTIEPVNVDQTLSGQTMLPFCGGCLVVETPGHTEGHISFYIPEHHTVIAGDAMVLENGKLIVANPEYALDLALAEQSLEKLLALKATQYVCYHGGVLKI